MSVFEPDVVRQAIRGALSTDVERDKFDAQWDKSVSNHVSTWGTSGNKSADGEVMKAQNMWSAQVVAYVSFMFSHAKAKKGLSASTQRLPFLKSNVPILGPRFLPPSLRHVEKRSEYPDISPEVAYLKPLNIIHPFYTPSLAVCPRCRSSNIRWDGWTSTGPRNVVYGIRRPELALGYQLRCNSCKKKNTVQSGGITKGGKRLSGRVGGVKKPGRVTSGGGKKNALTYSCSTTNPLFWEKWEYWEIPRETPIFFKRCAVTRELLDLIVEVRLTTTSRGLAENIKQLHLLEYHQVVNEYLECFQRRDCWFKPHLLKEFSAPWDEKGYNGKSISGDLITEIILDYSYRTRQEESSEYLRTLKAKSISIDATFKVTQKATVASTDLTRTDPHKGGLMSAMSETNECMKWKFSVTQSNGELREFLSDLSDRFVEQEEPPPEDVTADNCCHVRSAIVQAFPHAHVGLDVYHFMLRYSVATANSANNPWRSQVMCEIRDAILISNAQDGKPAKYRTKEEQAERLEAVYVKWAQHGGVWSAAAAKVHADQMRHVRNGCLTRVNQDIATDGSRIEGSHKGWNSIMRSHASGIEMFIALGHDHVLRRNIRVALRLDTPTAFVVSTYGSHHTRLVNRTAHTWNKILESKKRKEPLTYREAALRPELPKVSRKEKFGLTRSIEAKTYNGLLKEEPDDDVPTDLLELVEEDSGITFESISTISAQLKVKPADFFVAPGSSHAPRSSTTQPAARSSRPELVPSNGLQPNAVVQAMDCDSEIEEITSEGSARINAGTQNVLDLTLDDDLDEESSQATRPLKRKAHASIFTAEAGAQRKKAQASTPQGSSQGMVVRGSGTNSAQPGTHILAFFKNRKPPSRATGSTGSGSGGMAPKPTGGVHSTPPAPPVHGIDPAQIDPALLASDTSPAPALAPTSQQPPATAPPSGSLQSAAVGTVSAHVSLAARAAALLGPPLPIPASPPPAGGPGLSRSERMFAHFSDIDPRSMRIEHGIEFFVFMDLRRQEKWATFSMTARKWVAATRLYNQCLRAKYAERNLPEPPVVKHPRALVHQLSSIEATITDRILKQDFKSKTGSETFWREHCSVIPLVKTERGAKLRAPQTCQRCKSIKYTAGIGGEENHRRLYCSDGVRSNMRVADKPPPWPQPEGIWTEGKKFHVIKFINTLIAMYEAVVLHGEDAASVSLEYDTFQRFLDRRLLVDCTGAVFFPLYAGYEMVPDLREYLVVQHAGKECIRVSCLSGGDAASLQITAGTSPAGDAAGSAA